MPLDPIIQSIFDQMPDLANYQVRSMSPEQAREEFRKFCAWANPPGAAIGKSENVEAQSPEGPIPLRVYTPVAAGGGNLPALVYFHGGGFVLGDLDCYDPLCRALANESGCRVVSVDYRLAPEHPFPAAVEDCIAALSWIEANASNLSIDPNRIAVVGDSAGGNLAAVTCLLAKEKGGPQIAFQVLIYPVTASWHDSASAQLFGSGYMLNKPTLNWFRGHYVPKDADTNDPRLSPLNAPAHKGLPPTYIVTAGFDPLRDEGVAYAEKLKAAGVSVTHLDYPTMIHGFFSMPALVPLASEAIAAAARAVKEALA